MIFAIGATLISDFLRCLRCKDLSPLDAAQYSRASAARLLPPQSITQTNSSSRSWTNGLFWTVWIRKRRTIIRFWSMSNPDLSISNEKEKISWMRRATQCGMTLARWSSAMGTGLPRVLTAGHQPRESQLGTCSGGWGRTKLRKLRWMKSKR